jgi:hypothetical protein
MDLLSFLRQPSPPQSAALDAGSSINALVVFVLSVTLLKLLPMPHWLLNPAKDSEYCTPSAAVAGVAN